MVDFLWKRRTGREGGRGGWEGGRKWEECRDGGEGIRTLEETSDIERVGRISEERAKGQLQGLDMIGVYKERHGKLGKAKVWGRRSRRKRYWGEREGKRI
jgi:hypothetical protein